MRESLKDCGEPDEIFRVTIAGMKFYEDYFGVPFQFDKYDQIFCPEYNMGAMENVGLITLNELYCWKEKPTQRRRTGFAITVLHELAHMWFGDFVTMNWWNDLWLNESFATFISHLCLANSADLKETYTTSWVLFGDYKGYAYSADQKPTTHPVMSEVKDTDVAETDFDVIVYEKGSSLVKQMYYFIGDEAFNKGLKSYFKKYAWNNTVFEDFINEMINAAGDKLKNLKDMCHLWLQKAGLNEISLNMEVNQNTNLITKFVVNQKPCLEQYPNLINHMVDFLFIYDFEDFSKNKVFEKQLIEAKPETVFDFSK
jgi:aminopeptidase N